MIDVNLLDTSFRVFKPDRAAGNLVRAFQASSTRYFVIGDQFDPGTEVVLVDRVAFITDLVTWAIEDETEREQWLQRLTASPVALSTFIAGRVLKIQPHASADEIVRLTPSVQRRVSAIVGDFLREESRASRLRATVVDGTTTPPEEWEARSIVRSPSGVVGVFDEATLEFPDWRGVDLTGPATLETIAKPPAASEFKAHPRLTLTESPRRGKPFTFIAGLSDRPDVEADEQRRIVIADAQAGETLLVVVSAEGATIDEPNYGNLTLDLGASHPFSARVAGNADRVVLRAKYFFRNKLIGGIVKTVDVADAQTSAEGDAATAPGAVLAPSVPWPLADGATVADVDLVLMVESEETGWVTWTALTPNPRSLRGPFRAKLGDPAAFARRLAGIRAVHGDTGTGAHEELYGIGFAVGRTIPSAIVDDVLAPLLRQPTPPAILLMTDQPFVPWELARFAPSTIGREGPAFLGQLARIGRWWTGSSTPAPRSERSIQRISAVAASQYALGTNLKTLIEARHEREWLTERYGAQPVEGKQPDIDTWLDTSPRPRGHLGHLALHGFSDPGAGAHGVVLGDGSVLTPYRLAGEYYDGLTPRFEVLFLNACQVGTAGEQLGRIAGFPGALLSGGASGFIGPLWEVDDGVARELAADFYRRTLDDTDEVGEALRAIRASRQGAASITPWAYLYYGHPRLRLTLTQ